MTASTEQTLTPSPADQAAVAGVPQRIMAAWGAQDADAFAQIFTPDGTMVLPGVYQKGREAIGAFMRQAFAGPYRDTQVVGEPIDVRFIGPDQAVLVTVGGVRPAAAAELPDAVRVRATWVIVRDSGSWSLAAYQNGPYGDA